MSSSDEEDLSKFKEAVDTTFISSLKNSDIQTDQDQKKKSNRHLEVAGHYNDVVVPKELRKKIASKISLIINKNVEYVDIPHKESKKRKIKGGVKLFRESKDLLQCEELEDTLTEAHNKMAKDYAKRSQYSDELIEAEKIKAAAINGDDILSKREIKHWKSRRREKIFKYKRTERDNMYVAIE